MTGRKRLTLLVEGDGDVRAVPVLVNRLLDRHSATSDLFTDEPMRVGNLFSLVNQGSEDVWLKRVSTAAKRRDLAAILLLIDGDCDGATVWTSKGRRAFCAATVAEFLAARARDAGAGIKFSLEVVFARQEYESWLIGGIPDIAKRITTGVGVPDGDLEDAPRGAKEWLIKNLRGSYKPTRHQAELTRSIEITELTRKMRSFARLDHAVQELIQAVRTGRHVVGPMR